MDYFDEAYNYTVIGNEGGVYSDPETGELSNRGISQAFLKLIKYSVTDPKQLSEFNTRYLYRRYFWNFYNLYEIHNPIIAIKCFDMYVNMSNSAVAGIIQNSVNFCHENKIKVDHVVGPVTISALNECSQSCISPNLVQQSEVFYRSIAKGPLAKNLPGWLKRAAKVPQVSI